MEEFSGATGSKSWSSLGKSEWSKSPAPSPSGLAKMVSSSRMQGRWRSLLTQSVMAAILNACP